MKRKIAAFIVEATIRFLARVSLGTARKIAGFIAKCLTWSNASVFKTTKRNIEHCFRETDQDDQRKLSESSLYHFGCDFTELGHLWYRKRQEIEQSIVDVHGLEQAEHALKTSPVIALVPHLGCWELAGYFLGSRYPTTVLFSARRLGSLAEMVKAAREQFGCKLVDSSVSGLRQLLTDMSAGHITLILPDQVPAQGRSTIVEFFGQKAQTTTLVHGLLERREAKVYVFSFLRTDLGFEIFVDSVPEEIYSGDVNVSAQKMNDAVEQAVLRDPAQYQWEYKRFRRIPDRDIYA